jgi:hypothetical protein
MKFKDFKLIEDKIFSLGFSKVENTYRYTKDFNSITLDFSLNKLKSFSIWNAEVPGTLFMEENPSVEDVIKGIKENFDKFAIKQEKFERFYDKNIG